MRHEHLIYDALAQAPGRPSRFPWRSGLLVVVTATHLVAVGCRPSEVVSPSGGDESKLRGIARVYVMAARDLGRPPANKEELMTILAPAMKNPDRVFRSSRDREDFVIIWGLDMTGKDLNSRTLLAHEQKGVNGKRLVLLCNGEVAELPEEQFTQFASSQAHKPDGNPVSNVNRAQGSK
jgi:hypothetical protein